jgi:hypothetical protein
VGKTVGVSATRSAIDECGTEAWGELDLYCCDATVCTPSSHETGLYRCSHRKEPEDRQAKSSIKSLDLHPAMEPTGIGKEQGSVTIAGPWPMTLGKCHTPPERQKRCLAVDAYSSLVQGNEVTCYFFPLPPRGISLAAKHGASLPSCCDASP